VKASSQSLEACRKEEPMDGKAKADEKQPGRFVKDDEELDDEVVNDSLGTIDPADSDGMDEEKETGDAKVGNKETRED
jgi:hypothetical protein